MCSTLDWSHDLLTGEERVLFWRLSAFSGSFTLEAAEEVCAFGEAEPEEIPDLLERLNEQSLVTVDRDTAGSRYGMLEPVRQYALERLEENGEIVAARERHAEHFLALAETAKPAFLGPEYPEWSERLERELHAASAPFESAPYVLTRPRFEVFPLLPAYLYCAREAGALVPML